MIAVILPLYLVLHSGAVNGNHAAVSEAKLHTGGIHIELTRNHLIHKNLQNTGLNHPKIFHCFSDCVLFLGRTLGLSGILRFRQIVVLSDLQPALSLDLRDIQVRYL